MDSERHSRPIPPYLQNSLLWDPIREDREKDGGRGNTPPAASVRVGHVGWCTCGNCMPMQTDESSICCREIRKIMPLLSQHAKCVCDIYYLRDHLVSREHLTALYRFGNSFRRVRFGSAEDMKESDFRITAYRAFTMWIYGYLGRRNKRPIPSCAVRRIRSHFPKPDKTYLGFISVSEDPDAADMCDYSS
ncbi:P2X purinoceptor 7-like [Pelodytes ibericus]